MELKAIDFNYNQDITVVSQKQYEAHQTLYKGYIAKANEIEGLLRKDGGQQGNITYSYDRGLLKGQSFALDGVILHELYFKNIGENGKAGKGFVDAVSKCFGSYEYWLKCFKACALSARGWAILAYEQRSKALVNMLLDTHDEGIIAGACPIIVLDMYEHAYFLDYATDKAKYFENFIDNINWDIVEKRLTKIGDLAD